MKEQKYMTTYYLLELDRFQNSSGSGLIFMKVSGLGLLGFENYKYFLTIMVIQIDLEVMLDSQPKPVAENSTQ